MDDRFRHSEHLHEEELQDSERLFGDQGPGVEVPVRAREALRQEAIEAERKVRTGDPAEEIHAEVREGRHDLVVLASSGKSRLEQFFLGSVARRVCEAAGASVLLMKPEAGTGKGDDGPRLARQG